VYDGDITIANDPLRRFFEFGKIYMNRKGHYIESERLCLYLSGKQTTAHWNQMADPVDIYYCKGVVSSIVPSAAFGANGDIKLGKKKLGSIASVSSEKRKEFGVDKPVWFVDMDWKAIRQSIEGAKPKFSPISKFPGTTRDLALVLDKGVQYVDVEKAIQSVVSDKMIGLDVFDVFESEKLGANKKSYAVRLEFLDTNKTIVDADVDIEMKKVIASLEKAVGAEIRG